MHGPADEAVRALLRDDQLVVSAITYAEVLTGARLGRHHEDQVRGFLGDLISEVLPVDVAVADRAAALRARTKGLTLPDALIVATAELAPGVDLVVTADRQVGKLKGLDCAVRLLSRSN